MLQKKTVTLDMEKHKWTLEEKLKIINEAKAEGVRVTLAKYGIFPATFYAWKRKLLVDGPEGLKEGGRRKNYKARIDELEQKVSLLQELLAEAQIELALKDELLKKKYPKLKPKRKC